MSNKKQQSRSTVQALEAHVRRCPQCRRTPQDLCEVGRRLLAATGKYIHVLSARSGL